MSRAWRDPDDVQQDMLDQLKEINVLLRAVSIKLDEQQRTNQLLEQILNELKNHFAEDGKKVVSGLDEGDPKGDESVIIVKKPVEEKKQPLLIVFDADSPRGYCIKCDCETVYDKIHHEYFCPHCRKYIHPSDDAICPVCKKVAELVHGAYMTDDDWIFCKHCGVSSRRPK